MANPFDFSSGAVLTAAQLNEIGKPVAYTPTFTNLTVGSGSIRAFYTEVNKVVVFGGTLTFAADTTIDSTLVSMTLPVATDTTSYNYGAYTLNIMCLYVDASAGLYYLGQGRVKSVNDFYCYYERNSGNYNYLSNVTSTTPFTWTTSDWIIWKGTYRAAE